jgi:SAM-dependent methyltransferase
MLEGSLKYTFRFPDSCNMCGSGQDRFSVLGMRLNKGQGFRPKQLTGIAVGVRQCGNCGLIFADPQPEPEHFEDHYGDSDAFWREDYFRDDPDYFATEIEEAQSLIGDAAGPKALDIGAGIGKAMRSLAAAGFDTFGIEPSEKFRHLALHAGADPARLILAGIEDASFEPESFDFITFGAVLEHLPSPSEALRRALEWLKPGGIIQAEVPSSKWLISRLANLYFRLRGTNYVTNISPMHSPFHLFEFGLRSFELHGSRCGYEVALHRYSVCEIPYFPRFIDPLLRWWMERTSSGMQLTVYLRKLGQEAGPVAKRGRSGK